MGLRHLLHVGPGGAALVTGHQEGRRLKHRRLDVDVRVVVVLLDL